MINSEEGVLFAEIAALSNDGTYRQILLHDNAYSDRIALRYMPTSNQIDVYLNNGTVQAQFSYNLSNALDSLNTPGGLNQTLRNHMEASNISDNLVAGLDGFRDRLKLNVKG